VEVGLAGDGETGRKCREFILCMCGLGPDGAGPSRGGAGRPRASAWPVTLRRAQGLE